MKPPSFVRLRGWLGIPVFPEDDAEAAEWRPYSRRLGMRRVYLNDLTRLRDLLRTRANVVEVWNGWPRQRQEHIEPPRDFSNNLTQVRRWAIVHARTDDWVLHVTLRFAQAKAVVNARTSDGYDVVDEVVRFFDELPGKSGDRLSRLGEPLVRTVFGAAFLIAWFASGRTLHWAPDHLLSNHLGLGDALTVIAGYSVFVGLLRGTARAVFGSAIIVPYPRMVDVVERPDAHSHRPAPADDSRIQKRPRAALAGKIALAIATGVLGNAIYGWLQ